MKRCNLLFILLIFLASFSSCSSRKKNISSTNFKLVLGGSISSNYLEGGGFIFGKSNTNNSFSHQIINGDSDLSLDLENGNWTFSVIIWDGTDGVGGTESLNGQVRCDVVSSDLTGGSVDINLNLDSSKCANPYFGNQNIETNMFPKIDFQSCMSLSGSSVFAETCDNGRKGLFTSFKISLVNHKIEKSVLLEEGSFDSGLQSECFTVNSDMSSGIANYLGGDKLNFPKGSSESSIKTIVRGYTGDTGCLEGEGFQDIIFHTGIHEASFRADSDFDVDEATTPDSARLFLIADIDEICNSASGNTTSGFAVGTMGSSWYGPYGICTPEQFNLIGNGNFSSNSDKVFSILKDLDFLNTNTGVPGTNIVPIGDDSDGTAGTPFSGSLFGNFKTLSHISLTKDSSAGDLDQARMGVIRFTNGTGSGVRIENLTIKKSNLECDSCPTDVGFLIGRNEGILNIENVKIHAHVSGRQGLGGVIGANVSMGNQTIINHTHINALINSREGFNDVGGIIGMNNGKLNLIKSSFSGSLSAEYTTGMTGQYVGGLVGRLGDGSNAYNGTIDQCVTKGLIQGYEYLGGLVGKIDYGSSGGGAFNITNSYSLASINTSKPSGNYYHIGGLVGDFDNNNSYGSLDKSFYAKGEINVRPALGIDRIGGIIGLQQLSIKSNLFRDDNYNTTTTTGNRSANLNSISGFNTGVWIHPDSGSDIPRLAWELEINQYTGDKYEDEIPYLKRECTGTKLTSVYGAGTASDPKWICNLTQFLGMNNTSHYILKTDIDFKNTLYTTNKSVFGSGKYIMNGNDYKISGVHLKKTTAFATGDSYGIFSNLLDGSIISNLNLHQITIELEGAQESFDTNTIGLLAGKIENGALVDNIKTKASFIKIKSLKPDTQNSYIGGLVGTNLGDISNSNFNGYILLDNLSNAGSAGFYLGGLVGKNNGVLGQSSLDASLDFTSPAAGFDSKTSYYFGGFVGLNHSSGTIDQVSANNININISNFDDGGFKVAGMVADNKNIIRDSLSEIDLTIDECSGGSFSEISPRVASYGAVSDIQNTIVKMSSINISNCDSSPEIPASSGTFANNLTVKKSSVSGPLFGSLLAPDPGFFAIDIVENKLFSSVNSSSVTHSNFIIANQDSFNLLNPEYSGSTWIFDGDDSIPFLRRGNEGDINIIKPGF